MSVLSAAAGLFARRVALILRARIGHPSREGLWLSVRIGIDGDGDGIWIRSFKDLLLGTGIAAWTVSRRISGGES
jgi:hypothetical protein